MSDCSNHKIEQLGAWLIVAAKSHRPQRPKASSPQLYIQHLGRNTLRKLEGGWRGVSASGLWGLLLEGNCITVKRKARTACKHNAAHKHGTFSRHSSHFEHDTMCTYFPFPAPLPLCFPTLLMRFWLHVRMPGAPSPALFPLRCRLPASSALFDYRC